MRGPIEHVVIDRALAWESSSKLTEPMKSRALLPAFQKVTHEPESILRFANRFGLLHRIGLFPAGMGGHPADGLRYGENVAAWHFLIDEMAALDTIWQCVQRKQSGPLGEYVHWGPKLDFVAVNFGESGVRSYGDESGVFRRWKKGDLLEPARYALLERLSSRLDGVVSPAITPDHKILFIPKHLEAALWLRFALDVQGNEREPRQCKNCGDWFVPERTTRVYCSDACRARAARARQRWGISHG